MWEPERKRQAKLFIIIFPKWLGWKGGMEMDGKSYFIVFEGIDGCGKSTQMMMASKLLFGMKRFHPLLLTREPTLRNYGNQMRKILASDEDPKAKAKKCLGLYLDDRKEHLRLDVLPVLNKNGAMILCDRYKHSTYAFQQAQEISFSEIDFLHRKLLVPDLTLIFDVPVETALQRMKADANRIRLQKFEQKEFLKKVRQNYLKLKKQLPKEKIVVIDGDRPKDEVFRSVQKEIMKLIGRKESNK